MLKVYPHVPTLSAWRIYGLVVSQLHIGPHESHYVSIISLLTVNISNGDGGRTLLMTNTVSPEAVENVATIELVCARSVITSTSAATRRD